MDWERVLGVKQNIPFELRRHAELDRLVREKELSLQMCKEVSVGLQRVWSLHAQSC